MGDIVIRQMKEEDIEALAYDLQKSDVHRDAEYFNFCFDEVKAGKRIVFLALEDGRYVGTAHFLFHSKYPQFNAMNIPEINDLVVVPDRRKKGIGEELMNTLENFALSKKYSRIGLGVGLYKDYGSAQRLYVKRGYLPDGYGVLYDYEEVAPGTMVRLDDELNICLIKPLY